jgi:protoheme ferro-lyase
MPLSFVADCLETIYDLDIVATQQAHEAGIEKVIRVRAFNDDPKFAQILAELALEEQHVFAH